MNIKPAAAKAALRNEDSHAFTCLLAVKALLSDSWLAWEPESIWLELQHLKVNVPLSNREQILAGRSLITTGRFWYDMHAFERTCIAFNNEEPTNLGIEDAPVAYICWAVKEADDIYRHFENGEVIELDREPMLYSVIQMFREGFALAPAPLQWVQRYLNDRHAKDADTLTQEVKEGWAAAPKDLSKLKKAAFPETPAGVQLARLAAVHIHTQERTREREQQLAKLTA